MSIPYANQHCCHAMWRHCVGFFRQLPISLECNVLFVHCLGSGFRRGRCGQRLRDAGLGRVGFRSLGRWYFPRMMMALTSHLPDLVGSCKMGSSRPGLVPQELKDISGFPHKPNRSLAWGAQGRASQCGFTKGDEDKHQPSHPH